LYSAFTAFLGFEVNEGEYKVMGWLPLDHPDIWIRFINSFELTGMVVLNLTWITSVFITQPIRLSMESLRLFSVLRGIRKPTFSLSAVATLLTSGKSREIMRNWANGTNITPTWPPAFRL